MGEHTDKAKGKIKQAAGDLTDNSGLEREGKRDELTGKAKGILGDLKDKAEDVIDSVKEKADETRNRH